MAHRHGLEDKLTARQRVALVALLEAPTVAAASEATKIHPRSLHRWLADPTFAEAFRAASRRRLDRSVARMRTASERALNTLQTLLEDVSTPAHVKARVALGLLDLGTRVDLDDLRVRVDQLEAARTSTPTHT